MRPQLSIILFLLFFAITISFHYYWKSVPEREEVVNFSLSDISPVRFYKNVLSFFDKDTLGGSNPDTTDFLNGSEVRDSAYDISFSDALSISLKKEVREFASKLQCHTCNTSYLLCTCRATIKTLEKLNKIDFTNKTDEEILRELFLTAGDTIHESY